MTPLGEPSDFTAWRGQYLRRLAADAYPYRWLDTNAPPPNKKTQLALCLNYPFASGSVFKFPTASQFDRIVTS